MTKKASNPPPPGIGFKPPPPTEPPPLRPIRPPPAPKARASARGFLPVLENHDQAKVIGVFEMQADGTLVGTFKPGAVTREALLFLSGGYRLLELEKRDGVEYVRRAELLCLSTILNPTEKKA